MLYLIFAILAAALDQFVKHYATTSSVIAGGGTVPLIPGIVHMTYTENTGVAFSFLSGMDMRWILVGISAVCAIIIIIAIFRSKMGGFGKFLLALILGGAVGNLIDRAMHGYVVDMFAFEMKGFPILNENFPVFNLADVFITVGVIIFVIYYIIYSIRSDRRKKAAEAEQLGDMNDYDAEDHVLDISTVDDRETLARADTKTRINLPSGSSKDLDIYGDDPSALSTRRFDAEAQDEQSFTLEDILQEYELEKLMNDDENGNGNNNG